jgi:nitroreductase
MANELDLLTTLRSTGSVRGFTDEAVSEETVRSILDTARFAPSGGNAQGWGVISVTTPAVRLRLQECSQSTWDEYAAQRNAGRRPFAADESGRWPGPGDLDFASLPHSPNPLLDALPTVPVLLVVTADLGALAAMDTDLDRVGFCAGASVYPFCWSILLAARAHGLGGVMTTFIVRREPELREPLGLHPTEALAAMLCLGVATHQNTKLSRHPVDAFLRTI